MNRHTRWSEFQSSVSGDLTALPGAPKPNFFIIGSMKSGTTYLWSLLASHPSIFLSRPKEPTHFVEGDQLRTLWPWGWGLGFWKSESAYLELFRSAGTAPIIGEASVHYTHWPLASGVAERIHQFNPNARLLYVMRDPIERTISHYWHRVRVLGEHRSLSDAIKNDPQYTDVSHYAMQLAPYSRLFARDQIKAITFEELTGNANETLRSILRWLDVDCSAAVASRTPENATPEIVEQRIGNGLFWGMRGKSRLVKAVLEHSPTFVRRAGLRLVTRRIDRTAVDTSEVVQYLRPLQQRQTEDLAKLLGRQFPEWTTLYPSRVLHSAADRRSARSRRLTLQESFPRSALAWPSALLATLRPATDGGVKIDELEDA
jgi:Sulfotransferase family